MRILSKKYLRVLLYLALAISGLFWYRRLTMYAHPVDDAKDQDTKKQLAKTWLQTNNLEHWSGSKIFVVNVGRKKCYHVGKLLERCFIEYEMAPHTAKHAERKLISKDLRGSYGFNWFGVSEYVFYDTLSIESLSSTDEEVYSQLVAVHSISNKKTLNAFEWIDNVFVEAVRILPNLSIDNYIISNLDILFGEDCVDPRPGWQLNKSWSFSKGRFPSFLSYKYLDHTEKEDYTKQLQIRRDGKLKIVQLADLHFSVGKGECEDEFPASDNCEADPKTLRFIEGILDIEEPDLVVFTGDQIMGQRCVQDSTSALLKVLAPVIERKIPWALIWGNHDHEGSLDRWKLSEFTAALPYSLFSMSARDTNDNSFGVGNYILQLQGSTEEKATITLYFFDSHSYSRSGKIYPGYDWIKEAQWEYMRERYDNEYSKHIAKDAHLSMAFFHIPIPEYLSFQSKKNPNEQNPKVGTFKEGVTAPKYNPGGIFTLDYLGVDATSCGHDHCNDYCILDDSSSRKIWLCFGGGSGEGGYAGYGGTERRIRIYEFDTKERAIYTWKRLNGSLKEKFDYQPIVSGGVPNFE